MKVMHLSDLHIGKYIFERSLICDQEYILNEIIEIVKKENVKVIMISGDVYDKQIPSTQAVELLNDFLTKLIKLEKNVLIIPGNHDSDSRLSFGNEIFSNNGLIIENSFNGTLKKITIEDVNFFMLPFVKPLGVRKFFENCESYHDAIRLIIENSNINYKEKNILMTHQFYTYNGNSPELSESELNLGGIDNIDIGILENFDYVAMGHIHRPQKLYKDTFRYSGSILKYSFQESNFNKSVPIIDTVDFTYKLIELKPLRDMVNIKGNLNELLENTCDDYVRVILTDENELIDPVSKLRRVYPNLLRLEFSNKRYNYNNEVIETSSIEKKTPLNLFEEFYLSQNNVSLDDDLRAIFNECMEESYETN